MRVHTTIVIDDHSSLSHAHLYRDKDGVYFIPFTPTNRLPLFKLCDGYDAVCRWFDYLKAQGYYPVGYVIMPNHLHALIAFKIPANPSIQL